MKLRWFLSGTVRQACELSKHVRKLLCAERDILSPQAVQALEASLQETDNVINSGAAKETVEKQMAELEKAANKWLKPYPHATWRENVEVLLVAIAVAMAVRTFFLQPFKIPTGSMQPTLYGVIARDLTGSSEFKMPSLPVRIFDACAYGVFYHEMIAPDDGEIIEVPRVKSFGITKQPIVVQYKNQPRPTVIPIWFAPDDPMRLFEAGLVPGRVFKKDSPIFRFSEATGDHLFVDRLTYNFRHPKRGEIVVFKTHGIDLLIEGTRGSADNQFYIKRLVGLSGERLSIGEDRHIRINDTRLDSSTPHFENVYSFNPKFPARDSQYSGHTQVSDPRYPTFGADEFTIRDKHYFVCGDNTANSLDSRFWLDFPQENVIGKYCFVYWPISSRFGWCQK